MAEYPAFPLFTDAYLGDTKHLTTIEHGAYLLLLICMWRSKGKLPNNDKLLARYSGLTTSQWKRIKPMIWPFFEVTDDDIKQPRLTDELSFVRQNSKRQSDKAKARWLKTKKTGNSPAMPDVCPPPHPTHLESNDSKKISAFLGFDEFWKVWPNKTAKPKAKAAWGKLKLEDRRLAFSAAKNGWYQDWVQAHPDANKISPVKFINDERWTDEPDTSTKLPAINSRSSRPHDSLMAGFAAFANSEPDAGGRDCGEYTEANGPGDETMDCGPGGNASQPILRIINPN